jgi:hypothetical protein
MNPLKPTSPPSLVGITRDTNNVSSLEFPNDGGAVSNEEDFCKLSTQNRCRVKIKFPKLNEKKSEDSISLMPADNVIKR